MKTDPSQDKENLTELLRLYQSLRSGISSVFLEEEAFEKIIDHFDEEENIAGALEAAEIASEYFPYSSSILLRKADLLLASRRYHDALAVLEKAELFDANDINLYILKTDAFLAIDQQQKAVDILEQALARFDGTEKVELLFELADVYDDYEEFDKVFDCLKMILEVQPDNEEALYKICFWTDFTGRNEESITLHSSIIDEFPYSELAWFNLGAAYQGLKLYEKGIEAYKYALAIDEKFDYAYRNIGDAYIRLRKYKDAIEALERVLELSKPEEVIYEAIGYCYDKLRNYAQARFHYRKASHLNPEDGKLLYKIAATYYQEGQWNSAVKVLESALKLQKLQPEYNLLMGECKLQLNEPKEAVIYFSTAVRSRPKNIGTWEALIRCLYNSKLFQEAKHQATTALNLTQKKPVFFYYLAAISFATNKQKDGLHLLEQALRAAPRQIKKFIELLPSILQNPKVVDLIARYKKTR